MLQLHSICSTVGDVSVSWVNWLWVPVPPFEGEFRSIFIQMGNSRVERLGRGGGVGDGALRRYDGDAAAAASPGWPWEKKNKNFTIDVSSRTNPPPVGVGDSLQRARRLDKLFRQLGG